MAGSLEKPKKQYALNQCALYGLRSRGQLAGLLHWQGSVSSLQQFCKAENYRVFASKPTGRIVQEPKDLLKGMHVRIATLLRRVATPNYLHSGIGKRSYISNARAHASQLPTIKLDIRKFYPSTKWGHVFRFFRNDMRCVPDVAGLLATICCYRRRHLPTGSCLSQVLSFWTFKPLFDAIHAYCSTRGGVMTLYVDDITATIANVSHGDIKHVGRLVQQAGLDWGKGRLFAKGRLKTITGVVMKIETLRAPNRLHKKLGDGLRDLGRLPVGSEQRAKAGRSAVGRAQAIAQVDHRQAGMSAAVTNVVARLGVS